MRLGRRHQAGDGTTRYTSMTNGGPVFVCGEGRAHRPHHAHRLHGRGRRLLDHRGARPALHAAAQGDRRAARARVEIAGLFARPAALSDEARRFRSQRRAQPAEPRRLRLRAHLLGRGARHRRRRDHAREAGARAERHRLPEPVAPYLGQYRLLFQRAAALRQPRRPHRHRQQPRQLGRLVLGRQPPLGLYHAHGPRRGLRHGRGPAAARRDGGVLVERPGVDERRLWRPGRHGAPPVAEAARHPHRPYRPLLQPHARPCWAAPGSRRGPAPTRPWRWRSPMSGSRRDSTTSDFVAARTHGFETWKRYILGGDDGVRQDARNGRSARPAFRRAPCARWRARGARSAPISAPAGSATASAAPAAAPPASSGRAPWCASWRCRGWAGRASISAICNGARRSISRFWFPGYAEGGISGDVVGTAAAHRALSAHAASADHEHGDPGDPAPPHARGHHRRAAPRAGCATDRSPSRASSRASMYPAPGAARVRMLYRYGGTNFGTHARHQPLRAACTARDNLEFVVNQSIWMEGEAKFADVILPACTSFERWDISEWAGVSGYAHHSQMQVNHRVVTMQHKCIEPLGESKSDYEIFFALPKRLGLGAYYSEGMTELDWVQAHVRRVRPGRPRRRGATSSRKAITWCRRPSRRAARRSRSVGSMTGARRTCPSRCRSPPNIAAPSASGLGTPTGKFEFECETLKAFDAADEERPPILKYRASSEGAHADAASRFPAAAPHAPSALSASIRRATARTGSPTTSPITASRSAAVSIWCCA